MNMQPKIWTGGLLLALTALAAACGGTSASSEPVPSPLPEPSPASPKPTPTPVPAPTPTPIVETRFIIASDIQSFTFENLTVEVGTRVVWTNRDPVPHTSTSGFRANTTGIWDGPYLDQDESFSFTFGEVGTFQYFCAIHPSLMNATVTVVAEGALGAAASGSQSSATPSPRTPIPDTGFPGF